MILLQLGRAKLNGIRKNNHFKDMNRIDGMPTEFEWKIFLGITKLGLFEKIQSLMRDLLSVNLSISKTIIFMSMYKDIERKNKRKPRIHVQYNPQTAANYARKFPRGHSFFLGLQSEERVVRNLH